MYVCMYYWMNDCSIWLDIKWVFAVFRQIWRFEKYKQYIQQYWAVSHPMRC